MLNSTLINRIKEFAEHKRSSGIYFKSGEEALLRFARFCEEHHPDADRPTEHVVLDFMSNYRAEGAPAAYGEYLRGFARFLSLRGIADVFVLPKKWSTRTEPEPPYFFTDDEIHAFFKASDELPRHKENPGRELVVPALFRLMYCCGVRTKEARMLKTEDAMLNEHRIVIRNSKGSCTRQIYISEDVANYLKQYDSAIAEIFPNRTCFFPVKGKDGEHFPSRTFVRNNFRKIWLAAFPGFEFFNNRPRPYDFRHHFAYTNINQWAKDPDVDVNAKIAYLMRYMGHRNIRATLYYFHFVPGFFQDFKEMTKKLESIIPEVPYEN